MITKNCILCKSFRFNGGHPGYSEYTPGSSWNSNCELDHWEILDGDYINEKDWREITEKAIDCKDYQYYKEK